MDGARRAAEQLGDALDVEQRSVRGAYGLMVCSPPSPSANNREDSLRRAGLSLALVVQATSETQCHAPVNWGVTSSAPCVFSRSCMSLWLIRTR